MHQISIIGTGYVGLVTGTCLADFGLNVICVDNDVKKIEMLKNGEIPIYEPGLKNIVERNVYYKRLTFTTDTKNAVENSQIIFIAVGTPPAEDGSADLQFVLQVAREIANNINGYKVIVNKSTVPIGTGKKVKKVIEETLRERGVDYSFDVVSNPEFLREGSAVHDFTHPDRVILGVESKKAEKLMKDVYRVLYINETPFVVTNIETAEMIKYASNAFLATKITFINELANLCEKVGADVHHVARAMGMDGRISSKFLHPGPGYGGSCFPKDTKALARIGQEYGSPVTLVEQAIQANENQKHKMVEKILSAMGTVEGKTLGILGITFKPNTDDMREAPSLTIIKELAKAGANFRIYDPQGYKEGVWRLKDIEGQYVFCSDEYEVSQGSEALIIITEWNQFRNLDLDKLKQNMKNDYFFDLRNIYERPPVEAKGFKYYCVGR